MTAAGPSSAVGPAELLLATTVAFTLAVGLTGYRAGRRAARGR